MIGSSLSYHSFKSVVFFSCQKVTEAAGTLITEYRNRSAYHLWEAGQDRHIVDASLSKVRKRILEIPRTEAVRCAGHECNCKPMFCKRGECVYEKICLCTTV